MKQILIHYGELSTKGRNRKMFQSKMAEHIRAKTKDIEQLKILAHHDYMYLKWEETDYEVIIDILKSVPGIQRFEPVYEVEKDLDAIREKAIELFSKIDIKEGDTFKVAARRSDKDFPLDTIELQREIGGDISRAFPQVPVDVRKPTHKLALAIQQEQALLSLSSHAGMGGLPYGSSGKGLLMLSGGFDSPIAGYEMIKRGMALEMVHFASPPYTSPQALDKAKRLTAALAKYGKAMDFHEVPFAEIQLAIREAAPDNVSMTLTRRMMLRIMEAMLKERKAQAIVNGESLGQVASQTIQSMRVINEVTNALILRPLIARDKNDIIALAEEIGTHDISNEPFEDCCTVFAPKSPWTKPRLHVVEKYEAEMPIEELVANAIKNMKTEKIDSNYQDEASTSFTSLL